MNNNTQNVDVRDEMVEIEDEALKSVSGGCGTPTTLQGTCPVRRGNIWTYCP